MAIKADSKRARSERNQPRAHEPSGSMTKIHSALCILPSEGCVHGHPVLTSCCARSVGGGRRSGRAGGAHGAQGDSERARSERNHPQAHGPGDVVRGYSASPNCCSMVFLSGFDLDACCV